MKKRDKQLEVIKDSFIKTRNLQLHPFWAIVKVVVVLIFLGFLIYKGITGT